MEKKIKWEKPVLKDLHGGITIGGSCYTGDGFVTQTTCSEFGSSASTFCTEGGGVAGTPD